jgi:hypothetical protein
MSLDLAVLAEDGTPEQTVSMPVNLHHVLIAAANKLGLDQLLRLREYYEDVEFLSEDLPRLSAQVEALSLMAESYDLNKLLAEFKLLINNAATSGKALHAIAD